MRITLIILLSFFASVSFAQENKVSTHDPNKKTHIAEAACGQCKLALAGKGCDLAVRIEGKSYFVDGTAIDQHGDAHAKDGFCNAIRKAQVQGEIVNDRFVASYFKLLPAKAKKEKKKNKTERS